MHSILIIGEKSFIGTSFKKYSDYRNVRTVSLRKIQPRDIDFSGVDVVLHLAAIVHHKKSIKEETYFIINRDLAVSVAEEAKKNGVRHFIFMSTTKVYGDVQAGQTIFNENTPCNPTDNYGKSKCEAEVSLRKLGEENFCISIIRTPGVYGYGMKANMMNFMRLIKYSPVLPFKDVDNRRSFTFVGNLVAYIDRIIKLGSPGTFIAMDPEPVSTTGLMQLFLEYSGKKPLLFRVPKLLEGILRHTGIYNRLFGSFELENKITLDKLSFFPPYSTREGILKMMNEYLTKV